MKNTKKELRTNKLSYYLDNITRSRGAKALIWVSFFLLVYFISYFGILPTEYDLKVGDLASEDIYATKRIVDAKYTEDLRYQAQLKTANIYDYIPGAFDTAKTDIDNLFDTTSTLKVDQIDEKAAKGYNTNFSVNLTLEDYIFLIQMNLESAQSLRNIIIQGLSEEYSNEITADDLENSQNNITDYIDNSSLSTGQRDIGKKIALSLLKPNIMLNETATNKAKKEARDAVSDVVYEPGQTLVKKGDILTENQIRLLTESGAIREGLFSDLSLVTGLAAILFLIIFLFAFYLRTFYYYLFNDNKKMILILSQFVILLVVSQFLKDYSAFIIPVGFLSISLSIMFGHALSIQVNTFLVVLLFVGLQLNMDYSLFLILSSVIGVFATKNTPRRNGIYYAGSIVGLGNAGIILVLCVLRGNTSFAVVPDMAIGFVGGLLSSVLSDVCLRTWEYLFNILTPFRLEELTNPSNPCMNKIITEAPGTYHHSLLVSNMCEAAAKQIGANALLVRAGALYHDLGKTEKAQFFKENQTDTNNPHDGLSPNLSARIIKNHLNDGIYLARKYHVPSELLPFIETHHGTTKIAFFLYKAKEMGLSIGQDEYYYDGPKPSTKETALLLLADSAEAAVRSSNERNKEKIKEIVNKIFAQKINDGQLSESTLTLKDIETAKKAYLEVLYQIYHERIAYPEEAINKGENDK